MKKKKKTEEALQVQTAQRQEYPAFGGVLHTGLWYALRENIPVIDAAVMKLVRLTGGFRIKCEDRRAQEFMKEFAGNVRVGGICSGFEAFVSSYFEQLLTCGTAVAEIAVDRFSNPVGLYNAPLEAVEFVRAENGFDVKIRSLSEGVPKEIARPELIVCSALNPLPGKITGRSILEGLPFMAQTLMKIFQAVGANWERLGNVRFAVTYKPSDEGLDRAYAGERAGKLAAEWSNAMSGGVKDFVAVGDVSVRAIGSDITLPDSTVPVRQLIEQVVAKTGLPPFLLGLSWSTTERMSQQQADALTTELWSYRRAITPALEKICRTFLALKGLRNGVEIVWDEITLQDIVEQAKANYYNRNEKGKDNV